MSGLKHCIKEVKGCRKRVYMCAVIRAAMSLPVTDTAKSTARLHTIADGKAPPNEATVRSGIKPGFLF